MVHVFFDSAMSSWYAYPPCSLQIFSAFLAAFNNLIYSSPSLMQQVTHYWRRVERMYAVQNCVMVIPHDAVLCRRMEIQCFATLYGTRRNVSFLVLQHRAALIRQVKVSKLLAKLAYYLSMLPAQCMSSLLIAPLPVTDIEVFFLQK